MPVRRRNAIRRRLARLVQPQQQQQPTSGPQTDARPFSFDGREATTTTRPANPRHLSPTAPVTGPTPADTMLPRRQTTTAPSPGGQAQPGNPRGLYPTYQGESSLSAPERRPDQSCPPSHDSSWTSAYDCDSSLGPNPAPESSLPPGGGSLPLYPQHGRRRSLAVLSRVTPASSNDMQASRDLIPSNPFADEDEPPQPYNQRRGPPSQPPFPSSAAPVPQAVRTSRRESMSSSVYSTGTGAAARSRSRTRTTASDRVISTGAAAGPSAPPPLPRQPSWSSAISEVSEASSRKSVSPERDFDSPRRKRRYGWDGTQVPRLNFPE